ncbi:MAG: hypothetical protein ACRD3B_05025 [Candidatus Sulfotelmatobacter sp.]
MNAEQAQPVDAAASEPQSNSSDSRTLTEDLALAQLKNRDLSAKQVAHISQDAGAMKSRKVRLALAGHPRTPRRIALRVIRELYTFELMQFAMTPSPTADLKHVADELLVARLAAVSLGERISLARRSSQMVAAALLLDKEKRVWQPALENPRMTEAAIVKALQRTTAAPAFVQGVWRHAKWSVRPEIRVALLRNAHTPLARAIEFARGIALRHLRDILHMSRLPEKTKEYLRKNSKPGESNKG